MDIIHLLPDSVANQIAAGEVIQRPASCLKELVENSLDAGADDIQIIIRDAGRTLLEVIDNGKGMSPTDARMAFERHATSKITNAGDLFNLRTMGFRGEALASIAAVAQVELLTCRKEDEVGCMIEIAGSKVLRQEMAQTPVGTNIKVKNLFFNVPARRRFLKTDSTELRNLISDFYRIALVYPSVHFTFVSEDEILFDLPACSLKQRIEGIFGKSQRKTFASQLLDIDVESPMVNVYGYIAKPDGAGKQSQQYFFVNGRYMKHPYFHKAVMTAYQGMLMPDQSPSYFIYFDIAPDAIDINIHPTKTEIKFADEQSIWQILLAAVRQSLGKFNITPAIDFDREGEIDVPNQKTVPISAPHINIESTYNPFHRQQQNTYKPQIGWEQLYEGLPNRQGDDMRTDHEGGGAFTTELDIYAVAHNRTDLLFDDISSSPLWQYNERYIIMPTTEGLMLIDQHRAHQTVLCDSLIKQIEQQKGVKQQVLFPEILDLSAEDTATLTTIIGQLEKVGFEINQIDRNSFSIDGVPALLNGENALSALLDILHQAATTESSTSEYWNKHIAQTLARSAAVPYGRTLPIEEMREITRNLFALGDMQYTTDGKRIYAIISNKEIDKLF